MILQDLLQNKVDLEKTKLVRHNLSNPDVLRNYENGLLEYYQAIQTSTRFKNTETVISFLGTDSTNAVFQGCYQVGGSVPFKTVERPKGLVVGNNADDCVFYELIKTDVLAELKDRLVVEWGKGTINWCQKGTIEKEVLEIRPAVSEISFMSYDKTMLSFDALQEIVFNKAAHKEWENKLSAVAGVYLITDTKTGRHYVGSASGEQGGIWGRWSEYAHTKHGGNKRLMELITADADYCRNFQYSILEVFPIKRDRHEILEYEQLYKRKLLSIQYGLNDN